jgi:DNA invertase Pin-like site-specific DNA recombinase
MRRLLTDLRTVEPRPQYILMNRLDRVGRGRVVDSQVVLAELSELGVQVFTREAGFVKNESWTDELINAVRFAVARQENEAKADRSRAGHEKKRREGKHAGHVPYGTVLVEGYPRPYEPEAAVIRELFAKRLEGWGTHKLARHAAAIAPPKKKRDGSERKMTWNPSTISTALKCKTYRGLVVTEDAWDDVQALGRPPVDKRSKYPWPLRGAIRCTCGRLLSPVFSGPKRGRIRYYTCRAPATHLNRYPYHRADAVEAQFIAILHQLAAPEGAIARENESEIDLEATHARKEQIQRELAGIDDRRRMTWDLAEKAGISDSELVKRLDDLASERTEKERALFEVMTVLARERQRDRQEYGAQEALKGMSEGWAEMPPEVQREIAKAISAAYGGLWIEPERGSKLYLGAMMNHG